MYSYSNQKSEPMTARAFVATPQAKPSGFQSRKLFIQITNAILLAFYVIAISVFIIALIRKPNGDLDGKTKWLYSIVSFEF